MGAARAGWRLQGAGLGAGLGAGQRAGQGAGQGAVCVLEVMWWWSLAVLV